MVQCFFRCETCESSVGMFVVDRLVGFFSVSDSGGSAFLFFRALHAFPHPFGRVDTLAEVVKWVIHDGHFRVAELDSLLVAVVIHSPALSVSDIFPIFGHLFHPNEKDFESLLVNLRDELLY